MSKDVLGQHKTRKPLPAAGLMDIVESCRTGQIVVAGVEYNQQLCEIKYYIFPQILVVL